MDSFNLISLLIVIQSDDDKAITAIRSTEAYLEIDVIIRKLTTIHSKFFFFTKNHKCSQK